MMDFTKGLKLAKIGCKGITQGIKRGGPELAVLAGKGIILGAGTVVLTYLTKENQAEASILATRNAAAGLDDLSSDLADIYESIK